ncbi:protein TIC 40, chloroplastic-like [Actinidia eriantha]|uniref:protein TIC 40, chloroplastic-like n=1 Tax=Actinidia eriantha TaxID=165200 RepID=UPI00258F522E|nr:protein TIC 40, chloroplastic-like [Actinidia eriantha]
MQQAFKTLMGQMDSQNNQFNNAAFSPDHLFLSQLPWHQGQLPHLLFQLHHHQDQATSPLPATYQSAVTIDTTATATKVEAPPATDVKTILNQSDQEIWWDLIFAAFVDVSSEETLQRSPFTEFEETDQSDSSKDAEFADKVSQNGVSSRPGVGAASEWSSSAGKTSSVLSVEALEKMMEDPTVQKMVYPYLPEEMRNPTTFKWMLQNPQYRQQLEEMLNNMGGSTEWDNRMMDSLKNFDLSSPDVKQQFDQIGLTPEEVISKIMANPDVAMAFQNPRVQAAIMDCSQNPLSIAKYQNDKEVMDVFNKISELFPGMTGS